MTPGSQRPAANVRLIETEIGSSSAAPTPQGSLGLPDDLLRQASRRLGIMCLIMAGLWAANLLVPHVLQPRPKVMPDIAILRLFDRMAAVNIVVSLGLFWYTRQGERDPRLLLNLGLAYELLIALSIGVLDWHLTPPAGTPWIAIIILIFAAIVPSTPPKTLATASMAASMDPVAALIWKGTGQEVPGLGDVLLFAFPTISAPRSRP